MKNNTPDFKSVVAKSNELIEQMAKFGLAELRLIAFCLAHYDSRSPENMRFDATVSDLQSIFPITTKDAYAVVRRVVINLGSKPLEIKEGNARHFWNWFSGFTYYENEGRFTFKINPDLQPRLLGLQGQFTKYRLEDVYQFKAASTWKLYELLKKWLKSRTWETGLDELRLLLGVAGKYPRWSDFEIRLIRKAVKEINKTSDIRVEYTKVKRGRSISGLVFKIHPKQAGDQQTTELKTPKMALHDGLVSAGVNPKTAERYAREADIKGKTEHILGKLPRMIERAKSPKQKYILGAIQSELKQQSLFSDSETKARHYQEAIRCMKDDRKGVCKRRTNLDAVCEICSQIHPPN